MCRGEGSMLGVWGSCEASGPVCWGSGGALEERRVPDLWIWGVLGMQKPQSRCVGVCGGSGAVEPPRPGRIEPSGPVSQGSPVGVEGLSELWWSRDPGPAVLVGLRAGLGGLGGRGWREGGTGDTAEPRRAWRGEPGIAPIQAGLAPTDSPCAPSQPGWQHHVLRVQQEEEAQGDPHGRGPS